jgi:hypothetical protein
VAQENDAERAAWIVCRVHGAVMERQKGKATGSYRHGHHFLGGRGKQSPLFEAAPQTQRPNKLVNLLL